LEIKSKPILYQGKKHVAIEYVLGKDDILFQDSFKYAENNYRNMNVFSPGARKRSDEERFDKCLGGAIAERIVIYYITKNLCEHGIKAEIQTNLMVDEEGQDIDITLNYNEKSVSLEVRSSFSYKTTLQRIFTGAFSILGWYTTSLKPKETHKDVYITVVYHFWPGHIRERADNNNLRVFIAGGATKELMASKGKDKHLKMKGATYRVINPILEGMTTDQLCEEIVGKMLLEEKNQ
jgi:hypothetical protein